MADLVKFFGGNNNTNQNSRQGQGQIQSISGGMAYNGSIVNAGKHQIDPQKVLSLSSDDAYSPMSPGEFKKARSVPVVTEPYYFTPESAELIKALREQREDELEASKVAYDELARIEDMDAELTEIHCDYAGKVAKAELRKVKATSKLAALLMGLMPDYFKRGLGLKNVEESVNSGIQNMTQQTQYEFAMLQQLRF